jgi:hypothetical protein
LTEEKTKSKYEAVSVRRFQELISRETFASFQLLRYSGLHLLEFGLDFGSCARVSEKWMHAQSRRRSNTIVCSMPLEILIRFLKTTFLDQPSYALLLEE